MKVIAINIGNGKERIEVDGNVFLKSVKIGKWSHVTRIKTSGWYEPITPTKKRLIETNCTYMMKSSSYEKATKSVPAPGLVIESREVVEIERV